VKEFLWTQIPEQARLLIEDQVDELNGRPANVPPPPFPQTSQIAGGLRELRCHAGSTLYRILYRRSHNLSCCSTSSARTAERSLGEISNWPCDAGWISRRRWTTPIDAVLGPRDRTHHDLGI
jgi:hypothetical protein